MSHCVQRYFEDHKESGKLGSEALRGGMASVAIQYGNGALQLAAAVVLARLLTPDDFGLVAIITVITSFAPLLIDFGLGDATAQRSKITQGQVSSLFWLSTGAGLAIAILLAITGPFIAWLYREPRLEAVAVFSGISFVLSGMLGQHQALLRRTMQFAVIAKIQVLSTLAGIVAAIALAANGWGYWALVFRPVVGAACATVGSWLACRWRPGIPVIDAQVKSMVRFGMNVVSFSIVYAMARATDRIALGLVYRPQEVGYYQNAMTLYDNSIFSTLAQLHTVGSAALSKLQANPAALGQKYQAALSALAFFVMPAAAVLSVTADDLTVVLLGEKWRTAGLLLSILALRGVFQVIEGSQGWLHLSIGRSERWRNWGILTAVVQLAAILAGLPFGPAGVALAVVATSAAIAFPSIIYAGAPLNIGFDFILHAVGRQMLGAMITAAAGWWLKTVFLGEASSVLRIVLSGAFCVALYLLIVVGLLRLTTPIEVGLRILRDQLPAGAVPWLKLKP
jgi:PST family polysaccharide transporter